MDRNCLKIVYGESVGPINKIAKIKMTGSIIDSGGFFFFFFFKLPAPWPDQPDRLLRPCHNEVPIALRLNLPGLCPGRVIFFSTLVPGSSGQRPFSTN